ncbi:MAG: class II aldolase/adducin family protein [Candidatus Dormibacteraeota bacterium]|nr:class II aldolase/adducin family protein [Candidatus Dormibacteraeota bacterium]
MGGGSTRPELDDLLAEIADAGERMTVLDACEGAAGNISVVVGWPVEIGERFPCAEPIRLPHPAPALAGKVVIATGSGRRLRDLRRDPTAALGLVVVDPDGETGTLRTAPRRRFRQLTSEFNSHLAVHQDQLGRSGGDFNALIHAQPPHLTYLSHIADYREPGVMNRRLLRWEPETIVQMPEGIEVLPFILPGSDDLMRATVAGLRTHQVVVWSKHGVMARSDVSVDAAADRIDYLEAAARFEYLNLIGGGRAEGLSDDELRHVTSAVGVRTPLL